MRAWPHPTEINRSAFHPPSSVCAARVLASRRSTMEKLVEQAKYAEQAERYEDMATVRARSSVSTCMCIIHALSIHVLASIPVAGVGVLVHLNTTKWVTWWVRNGDDFGSCSHTHVYMPNYMYMYMYICIIHTRAFTYTCMNPT